MNNGVADSAQESNFLKFEKLIKILEKKDISCPIKHFTQQEMIRFYSISGTIINSFRCEGISISERHIVHPLLRTLLEGWIWIAYIFWKGTEEEKQKHYGELLNAFKTEYHKLLGEKNLPYREDLPEIPKGECWKKLCRHRNMRDMLIFLENNLGNHLGDLYFAYRVMSFDTHARASEALFSEAFGKDCSFHYIKADRIIDLISDYYLKVLSIHFNLKMQNVLRDI